MLQTSLLSFLSHTVNLNVLGVCHDLIKTLFGSNPLLELAQPLPVLKELILFIYFLADK